MIKIMAGRIEARSIIEDELCIDLALFDLHLNDIKQKIADEENISLEDVDKKIEKYKAFVNDADTKVKHIMPIDDDISLIISEEEDEAD